MAELQSLGAIYWSKAWLEALRSAGLDDDMLRQGETYARHDWGLETFIDKGRVEATAGSGRRLNYDVAIRLPQFSDEEWARLFERLAASSAHTAALLDGAVEPAVLEEARAVGCELLPAAGELTWECGCAQIVGAQTLCKHVAGTLYLLADSFDEDPFDLLLLRGRNREELRAELSELRTGSAAEPDVDEPADQAWQRSLGPLPGVPDPSQTPGELTAWATDPPPNAPFSAAGLRTIGTETAGRAWLRNHNQETSSHLQLAVVADLSRRAAMAEETPAWKDLVSTSGLTSRELSARGQAWRVGGTAGVEVQLEPKRSVKVSANAQVRQSQNGEWFRFEKKGGRWTLVAGPALDPEQLLLDTDITEPPPVVTPSTTSRD